MDAHFTSSVLASLKDAQSMKVISAPNVNARFKHTFTMHKQEQGTPHIITKPKHALLPPYAVNEKRQEHNENQFLITNQTNMTCLMTFLLLLSVPSTYANQTKTSSSSEDVSIKEYWIVNISPTINNLLIGYDCQNPTKVDSCELGSVE